MKGYASFLNDLGGRASGGDYNVVNQYGYLGKYQMGRSALIDTGYYKKDGETSGVGPALLLNLEGAMGSSLTLGCL